MSGSRPTIADDFDRLDNVHPGDILREDFLVGSEIPLDEVAAGSRIDAAVLGKVLDNQCAIDASIDARLTRYFGLSSGFFLRLQNSYDLEEVARNEGDTLAKIVRRAA